MVDFSPHLLQEVSEFNDDLNQFPISDLNSISEESEDNQEDESQDEESGEEDM